ncbi:hypothetical protein DFP72DRAFT_855431 [Ephemerocybe angulata]|uniref:CFEM domain-containing protein n=1 Tax=Ephemerocybe angulata TaxID=980116 RepID=A0A8H6LZ39_9AGAR|nr:hypothetical protein DFP72DRAFT_855431 [Tulosesus angulatus]
MSAVRPIGIANALLLPLPCGADCLALGEERGGVERCGAEGLGGEVGDVEGWRTAILVVVGGGKTRRQHPTIQEAQSRLSPHISSLLVLASSSIQYIQAQNATANNCTIPSTSLNLNITPCILGCVASTALCNKCSGYIDLKCVCSNAQFQANARACLQRHCTKGEVEDAEGMQREQCGSVLVSVTGMPTSPDSVAFVAPASSSSTQVSPSASTNTTTIYESETTSGVGEAAPTAVTITSHTTTTSGFPSAIDVGTDR